MSLTMKRIAVVSTNTSEICALLNVADEQQLLHQCMSSEAIDECIQEGETNLSRVEALCTKMIQEITNGNTNMYNVLCEYFLKRSKAYQSMYQRFIASGSSNGNSTLSESSDTSSEVVLLQEKVKHLAEELAFWRSQGEETEMNKRVELLIHKESVDLRKEIQASVQQLQTSLETVSKVVTRPVSCSNSHSDGMRTKMALRYWQGFPHKLVPFCDENGEYFVDWNNNENEWKFGNYGKRRWKFCRQVFCSLLLPSEYNANGLNERVVNVELVCQYATIGSCRLTMNMTHKYSTSANVTSTTFKCRFHLSVKHKDDNSVTELHEDIQCVVSNTKWQAVFTSAMFPVSLFSYTIAPNLRLTLVP